jgi:cobalt/nickel transport system ATP-binding protein
MNNAIDLEHVVFSYPQGTLSLRGISFSIERGRKVALVGPNGAGKTTLLLMCNGILKPDSGRVLVNGEALSYTKQGLLDIRRRVGFVFQNSDNQIFAPTVFADVAFGPLNLGMEKEEIRTVVDEALFSVGMRGYERRPPHHLSGGEKKRVAIAGVLAMKPDILIFDEPTSSLDPASAAEIVDLLDELNAMGKTIIISTHDVMLAFEWADEVLLMSDGRILHHGPPREVFIDQDLIRQSRLTVPPVLEIFCELKARGILSGSPPSGVLELMHSIQQAAGTPGNTRPGTIFVADAEQVSGAEIGDWISVHTGARVGAMGTSAKRLAEEENIALDFTYGVIDKCLLKVVLGQDTLIISSGGMIRRVYERLSEFSREHDLDIGVAPIKSRDISGSE